MTDDVGVTVVVTDGVGVVVVVTDGVGVGVGVTDDGLGVGGKASSSTISMEFL